MSRRVHQLILENDSARINVTDDAGTSGVLSTGSRVAGSNPAVPIIANGELVAGLTGPIRGRQWAMGLRVGAAAPSGRGGRQMAVLAVALRLAPDEHGVQGEGQHGGGAE